MTLPKYKLVYSKNKTIKHCSWSRNSSILEWNIQVMKGRTKRMILLLLSVLRHCYFLCNY